MYDTNKPGNFPIPNLFCPYSIINTEKNKFITTKKMYLIAWKAIFSSEWKTKFLANI